MTLSAGQPMIEHQIAADSLVLGTSIWCVTRWDGLSSEPPSYYLIPLFSTSAVRRRQATYYSISFYTTDSYPMDSDEITSLKMQLLERRCQILELEKAKLELERTAEKTNEKLTKLEAKVEQLSGANLELATDLEELRGAGSAPSKQSWSEQMMQMDVEVEAAKGEDPDPASRGGPPDRYIDTTRWPQEDRPVRYPDDTYFPASNTTYFHGSVQADGTVLDSPRSGSSDHDRPSGSHRRANTRPNSSRNPQRRTQLDVRSQSRSSNIPTPSKWQYPKHAVDVNFIEELFGRRDVVVADWGWADMSVDVSTEESTSTRVREDLLSVEWEKRPLLDSAEAVSIAIDLVVDGTRPDFAMPLVKLYNAADTKARKMAKDRGIRGVGSNTEFRTVIEDLPAGLKAVFILWEGYRRPGWVKDILIRHQSAPRPGMFEPTWVKMTWGWLHGPGVGVVNDSDGRISVAHSVGRGLWRLVAPVELYRPSAVAPGRWEYPVSAVWRLFACEGLYGDILEAHGITAAKATVVADTDAAIPIEDSDDLVECARWFAGRGLTPEDGVRLACYMQELVRDRARGQDQGKAYDEAVWVSRWLVNVRCTPLSLDASNWFAPDWPRRFGPLRSAISIRPRMTKHLLHIDDGDDDDTVRTLLKDDFDLAEYIPRVPGETQSEGELSIEGEHGGVLGNTGYMSDDATM